MIVTLRPSTYDFCEKRVARGCEIFKYLTIPQLDDCLAAGEFVKNCIAW
ncbi:TPA: hypothetical protein HH707_005061 [Escherichia coli]|nr:hypothetical protein [Escherichia coli]HAH5440602.1 hypothetical protein [Escherichia coli]